MTAPSHSEKFSPPPRAQQIIGALVGALLVAGAAAAVLVDPPATITAEEVVASYQTARDAPSVTIELTLEVGDGSSDDGFVHHSRMRIDNEADRSEFTTQSQGAPTAISGVVDGDRFLLHVPEDRRIHTGGRPWIGARLGPAAAMDQATSMTGVGYLSYVSGAYGTVETVGQEEVGGVATTRYRFPIDYRNIDRDASPLDLTIDFSTTPETPGDVEITAGPADIWLDEQGRPRRLLMELRSDEGGGATSATLDMTMFDYDASGEIGVPADAHVHEVPTAAATVGLFAPDTPTGPPPG